MAASEINARINLMGRPVADLKHAFDIDDYDFDGTLSGEFTVTGEYERPFGSGTMTDYGGHRLRRDVRPWPADVKLEGDNVRLENIRAAKGRDRAPGSRRSRGMASTRSTSPEATSPLKP